MREWLVALLVVLFALWLRLFWKSTRGLTDLGTRDLFGDLVLLMVGGAMVALASVLKIVP